MSKKRRLSDWEVQELAEKVARGKKVNPDKYKRSDVEKIITLAEKIRNHTNAPVGGGCSDPGKTMSSTDDRGAWGFFSNYASEYYPLDTDKIANDDSMLESLQLFADVFTREMRLNSNRGRNSEIIVDQVALDKIECLANAQTDHLYKDAAVIKLNGAPAAMVTVGMCDNKQFIDLNVVALPGDYSRYSYPYFTAHTRIGTQDFVDTAFAAASITSHLMDREGIDRQYMPPKPSSNE